jgi:hypothetical protein
MSSASSTSLSFSPVSLPFTRESVIKVLEWGVQPIGAPHSHKQIAEWCDRFWCQYIEVDASPEIESLLPILADVENQWDLYLANTYQIEELRSRSFEDERLPIEWFEDWLSKVKP